VAAEEIESQAAPLRGVIGRAASAPLFDLDRWAPSESAGRFVEHFWSVSWDLRSRPADQHRDHVSVAAHHPRMGQ